MASDAASVSGPTGRGWARAILTPALEGLRMYPRSALTIGLLVGGALATTLPVAWLTTWRDGEMGTALPLDGLAATGGAGPNYRPAASLEQAALLDYFRILGGTAIATLVVALLAALGLAAARASQRTGETTVRRAVGAGRLLLYGGLLAEGAILAGLTLGVGSGIAASAGLGILRGWPDGPAHGGGSAGVLVAMFTAVLLVTGLLLPVLFARRQMLGEPDTRPVPLLLPTAQLGLSLIALVAGALLARHATRLLGSSAAASREGAVYRIAPEHAAAPELSRRYRALLEGVTSPAGVSLAGGGAVIGAGPTNRITTDCGHCMDGTIPARFRRVTVTQQLVSADSFHALGVGVVAGRAFTANDTLGAPLVAVVSRSLAESYFQYGRPLGRGLRIQEAPGRGREADEWYEVVGIVDDRRSEGLAGGRQPPRAVYLSILQRPPAAAELLVRTAPGATPPPEVDAALRRSFGADSARVGRTSVSALIARESGRVNWFGRRFGLLGLVMLVAAAAGTATLMRGWVMSLRPELGLRRAAGATEGHLLRLILGRAALVGAGGVFFGVWFGPALWDALGALAAGLEPWDPGLVAALALLLFAATIGGVALPAWRATRETPAELLASDHD